jgi:hypothetical protein
MQRRAAAAYIVLFLVLAAGAYATLAAAHAPTVTIQDPAATLETGDTITAGDRQYSLTAVEASESGGGDHGGGAETTFEATFAWTNETARFTETWSAGADVEYENATYSLVLSNRTDSDTAMLRGQLPDDVPTYDRDGTTYVVVNDTGDREESVPLSEYAGVERIELSVGDSITYEGNDATVETVATDSVTISWRAPETTEVTVGQHGNVTLRDETYLAHFPAENSVQLTQDFRSFEAQQHRIDRFHERMNGLRGVIILSAIAIVLLAALAFLPVRE